MSAPSSFYLYIFISLIGIPLSIFILAFSPAVILRLLTKRKSFSPLPIFTIISILFQIYFFINIVIGGVSGVFAVLPLLILSILVIVTTGLNLHTFLQWYFKIHQENNKFKKALIYLIIFLGTATFFLYHHHFFLPWIADFIISLNPEYWSSLNKM